MACLKFGNSKLGNYTFGQIIVQYLNSFVDLEIADDTVRVYLNPSFVEEFGFPVGEIWFFMTYTFNGRDLRFHCKAAEPGSIAPYTLSACAGRVETDVWRWRIGSCHRALGH